jgi:hypothetical protein
MADGLIDELARHGVRGGGAAFALRGPWFEKPVNDLMRQKYDVNAGDIQTGLATAARLAGVAFSAEMETLAPGTFVLKPTG